jgi:hypothetical protein
MVRLAAWTVLAAALLAGCGEEAGAPEGAGGAAEGEEVALLRSFPASPSGGILEAGRRLVRDAGDWERTWALANQHFAPVPKAPPVDFGKEMVAVASLGEKRTGGHSVQIVGARSAGGKLRILYAERAPAPGAVEIQVITRPWHAVVLPRSELPVEWVRYEAPGGR